MARFTFVEHAEPDERFATNAFDESIGKDISVDVVDEPTTVGTLIAAEVAADRRSVALTVEADVAVEVIGGPTGASVDGEKS
jgi:hypothetical protein